MGMGNLMSNLKTWWKGADVIVRVRTGDRKGAGTDANVFIILEDVDGKRTPETKLDNILENDHERGQTCTYHIHSAEGFKEIVRIELWRDDNGFGADWYVDLVQVEHRKLKSSHSFPIQRWIHANIRHQFVEHDCSLPHNDPHIEQRKKELAAKKADYTYIMNVPGGPVQIANLPFDETFSDSYKWDIGTQKAKLMLNKAYVNWRTEGEWESLEQMKQVFQYTIGDEPQCLNHWDQDWFFGIQRVQGCNPVIIQLCKVIPENFAVTDEMVRPFLEGLSLQEALDSNRIFLVNLEILDKLVCSQGRIVCSPFALFFLNKQQKEILPIAIQLFQQKSPDNPVFLPSDPEYTWLLAKMYYNNADATYHQSLTHLGYTHLMMEGVAICTHRNLAPSHPLFRLLAPHFIFLLAINSRGLDKLVSPGGWVDKTMTVGREGMFNLIIKGYDEWRLDVEGTVPKEIEKRGVLDEKVLPYYPYRDDAISVYNAIKKYVTKMVHHYYASDEDIRQDYELQTWRKELTSPRDEDGVGMHGVAGSAAEGFTKAEEIIEVLTSIISICSVGHSAANFQQYHEYAFPPNYPGILMGNPPTDKTVLTEADIMQHIPSKKVALDTIIITKLLSSKGTKSLGDFEVQYLYDPIGLEAAHEFRQELDRLSAEIKRRNLDRRFQYPWLDPEIVPNAISI